MLDCVKSAYEKTSQYPRGVIEPGFDLGIKSVASTQTFDFQLFYYFCGVKNAFYAISLLLSFLIVLGHELVPHQHDLFEYNVNNLAVEYQKQLHPNNNAEHEHHAGHSAEVGHHESENNQKPSFPYHNHFYSDTEFDYTRLNTNSTFSAKQSIQTITLHQTLGDEYTLTPGFTTYLCRKKPFLISASYQPAANALRGPPTIA